LIKRIIYFVSEDWYFCSHRLPVARAAKKAGYDVIVVTRVRDHRELILKEGFQLVPLELQRSSLNPFNDFWILIKLISIYRKFKPDIVHHVALKPVIYGSIAARIARVPCIVNALAGMGSLFADDVKGFFVLLQPIVRLMMGFALRPSNAKTIVQNSYDQHVMKHEMGLPEHSVILIRGSGVDIEEYKPHPEPVGPVRITLVSRMIWDKGAGVLVDASKILKQRGLQCIVTLVGSPDQENPNSISEVQLIDWVDPGVVEWWGRRDDISEVWKQSHIACLPTSYREGLPKSLLEAAASGRPVITCDIPGCLELVEDNVNGLVVPVNNVFALVDAIEQLILDPEKRSRLGLSGRRIVEKYFSEEVIAEQTMKLYGELEEKASIKAMRDTTI